MRIRNPVNIELPYRPEITFDQRAMLIDWARKKKFGGDTRARGTDPDYPGSTYWELDVGLRITMWPQEQRLWATHDQNAGPDCMRILRSLQDVLGNHPPTRH